MIVRPSRFHSRRPATRPPAARRPVARMAAAAAAVAAGLLVAAASPAAAEPGFGTAPVVVTPPSPETQVTIQSVALGRHPGFDRVVFRLDGPTLGYEVKYVSRLVEDPTGRPLSLAGSAVLAISMRQTDWIDHPSPRVDRSPGFPALRQVRFSGEFEAVVSYGIGQASKAGFRVFRLTNPDRIVLDVKHPAGTATTPAPEPAAVPSSGSGAGTDTDTGTGGLAETGPATDPVPLAILGGLLALAGLVVAGIGVHVARRPAD